MTLHEGVFFHDLFDRRLYHCNFIPFLFFLRNWALEIFYEKYRAGTRLVGFPGSGGGGGGSGGSGEWKYFFFFFLPSNSNPNSFIIANTFYAKEKKKRTSNFSTEVLFYDNFLSQIFDIMMGRKIIKSHNSSLSWVILNVRNKSYHYIREYHSR